ncbi:30S ribosomal protein S19 [Candidatus Woesearchaeota archaeon]|nr:SSU ribosomal protein S19P [uncultured archaeon]MBS3171176.1 30S ribosomal protein S19 [Candidatus Woesearchaeota archaeon]
MAKEALYKGKNEKELKDMSMNDFILITTSRPRRALKRGLPEAHKRLVEKVKKFKQGKVKKIVKTHCRDMIVIPEFLGVTIHVYSGREFVPVPITVEKLGHALGEFVLTRHKVQHSAPGVGATRSSAGASPKK